MAEFVIALPVLFLLAAGAVDLANMLYTYNRMISAAREAARLASEATDPNIANLQAAALTRAQRVLADSGIPTNTPGLDIQIAPIDASGGLTQYRFLRVQISLQPNIFFGQMIQALGFTAFPVQLTARATGYGCEYFVFDFTSPCRTNLTGG